MAGGEGSRLRPLTLNTPKPMLPVVNVPLMEHIVRLCRRHNLTDIVATVQYLGVMVRNYFGDGTDFDVSLDYAVEEAPLGTAGSVGNARAVLDDTFLVISGDALTDIDLTDAIKTHRERGSLATIVLYRAENPLEFGIVITRDDGTVERFLEKPTWGQVFSDTVNTGIYIFEPQIFDYIPTGSVVDFSHDVFPRLLEAGHPIGGYVATGYWEDVGTTEAYMKAHRDVLDGRVDIEMPGFGVSQGVWQGSNVELGPDVLVQGPALIGRNCRLGRGCRLLEYTVLGDNVVVGAQTTLARSIVFDNAYIGRQVFARGCIVGKQADIREQVRIETDVVVGDGSSVGNNAVLNPAVKVYPHKRVEPGAIVNSSVVWESRAVRSLFGRHGVRGLANVDITPQLAVRLAMAYGSTQPKGALVACSRNASRAARALKRAFMAGLNATGVHVDDLEIASVPVARFHSSRTSGGVMLRSVQHDPESIEIRFFARDGTDLSEAAQRAIERHFAREDFRRVLSDEMGEIFYPPRVHEFYVNGLLEAVDADAISRSRPKLVLDYGCGTAALIMPEVLARLDADVLAVNPYAAERIHPSHLEPDALRLGELVRTSRSAFAMAFDDGAEHATLYDDLGRMVDPVKAMLLYVQLVSELHPKSKIVLPVDAPLYAQRTAEAAGCTVIWSQTSAAALMAAAREDRVALAIDRNGLILPTFEQGYDAVAQCLLTMELLARGPERLSAVVDTLPPVHLVTEEVPTPWERKGTVMRTLVEEVESDRTILVDGIKVLDVAGKDSWVLILPDPDEPVCHVTVEASSAKAARAIVDEYKGRIQSIV